MAEEHKRVEARNIVGTGMATDAERVRELEAEAVRRERAWRDAPERSFGEVLDTTPARDQELADTTSVDDVIARKKRAATLRAQNLPRVPPDPRMRKLHALASHPSSPPVAEAKVGHARGKEPETPATGQVPKLPREP